MDEQTAFERRLAAGLEVYAGPRRNVDAAAVARLTSATTARRPNGLGVRGVLAPAPRFGWAALAIIGLLIALTVGAAFIGGSQPVLHRGLPPATGPAGNGLIAYSLDGDIYLGDPSTGETRVIVDDPALDTAPRFSPDGTRIAFVRGEPWTADASVVVVRADGSDERIVAPAGFSGGGVGFTWMPDSASLLLNHDTPDGTSRWAGRLSIADAAGAEPLRRLTPPLPSWPGRGYFFGPDQVAQMFRPPTGDLILSFSKGSDGGGDQIVAWDADLGHRRPLGREALRRFEPYHVEPSRLWWSPDGSRFVFPMGRGDGYEGLFMMTANGSEVRRLDGIPKPGPLAWSPDGTLIAYEECYVSPEGDRSAIVIYDVASGARRTHDALDVATKYEGTITPTSDGSGGSCGWIDDGQGNRAWDHEGWTWSPDGRSIVMLETRGTHPKTVDVATGQVTDLPWVADSAPSWQRVAVD